MKRAFRPGRDKVQFVGPVLVVTWLDSLCYRVNFLNVLVCDIVRLTGWLSSRCRPVCDVVVVPLFST